VAPDVGSKPKAKRKTKANEIRLQTLHSECDCTAQSSSDDWQTSRKCSLRAAAKRLKQRKMGKAINDIEYTEKGYRQGYPDSSGPLAQTQNQTIGKSLA